MIRSMRLTRTLVWIGALVALAGASASGCNNGSSSSSTGHGTASSSGDDSSDDGSSSGSSSSDDGHAELTSPPGSRDPIEDDHASSSSESSSSSSSTPPPTTTASSSSSSSTTPAESPWGQSDADTGPPLPPRHAMSGSAASSFQQGMDAASRGDATAAQSAFQAALSADSSAFRAAYNLGVLADRAGNEDQALTYYRQSLRIQPDYELAIEGIVTIYLRRGDESGAVSFVQPLATQYVRNLRVTAIYGEALVAAGRFEEAITAARGALRRDERFVPAMIVLIKAAHGMGRNELANSILEQALVIEADNAELHYLNGVRLQENNQLAQALQEYRRAVELRPDYVDARMRLGLQLLAGANYTDAVQQFDAVAHLIPDSYQAHLNLGDAYRATKQYDLAKREFDRVIQMRPSYAQVHYDLGLMYMSQAVDLTGQAQVDMERQAQAEFSAYRSGMGASLPRDDQSQTYLDELARQIERQQKAIDRAAARAAKAAAAPDGGT